MTDITTKAAREELTPRREPYWEIMQTGAALGFRRGPDTWVVRRRDQDGKQHYQTLGRLGDYSAARKAAQQALDLTVRPGLQVHTGSVWDALLAYAEYLCDQNRADVADELLPRLEKLVRADPLGKLPLATLKQEMVRAWRRRLLERRDRDGRKLSVTTINRYYRMVAAGLSKAVELGWVGDRKAWQLSLLTDPRAERGQTAIFLTREQRDGLLAACGPEARAFFRALDLTGARPKEIAAAKVSDLYGNKLSLVHRKGRPVIERPRPIVLSRRMRPLFEVQAAGKGPDDFLFPSPDGTRWQRQEWAKAFRQAAKDAARAGAPRLPPRASAYALRHSRISELLRRFNAVTVAQYCGTSVQVIAKHYAAFIVEDVQEKLEEE